MKRLGFSLVELLVVIAIIALLIAISAPALHGSRKQAKTILCGSNIKQLILGMFAYEVDNEALPFGFRLSRTAPPGGYPGNLVFDKSGWWWFNYILDYSAANRNKRHIARCPSNRMDCIELNGFILHGNYGVNQSICKSWLGGRKQTEFVGTPLKTTDISRAARTLLIVDSGYSLINWRHATDPSNVALGPTTEDRAYVPGLNINKKKVLFPGQQRDAVEGRHMSKTVNIGFADGHVRREKADSLLVEKTGDAYRNRLHVWTPR